MPAAPAHRVALGLQPVGQVADLRARVKHVHLVALGLLGLAMALLMTPAAYHRVAEGGEDSEGFHRLASRLVVASMVPLALALCVDLFVVARRITDSVAVATTGSAVALVFFVGLWFVFTGWRRHRVATAGPARPEAAGRAAA